MRLGAQRIGGLSPVSMVCSTASVWPVRAEPGTGNRSTNCSNVFASWPLCESFRSLDVRYSSPRQCSGNIEGSHDGTVGS